MNTQTCNCGLRPPNTQPGDICPLCKKPMYREELAVCTLCLGKGMSSGSCPGCGTRDVALLMSNLIELNRACPFCKGDGEFDCELPGIVCTGCGATGPAVNEENCSLDDGTADAKAAWGLWNQRV